MKLGKIFIFLFLISVVSGCGKPKSPKVVVAPATPPKTRVFWNVERDKILGNSILQVTVFEGKTWLATEAGITLIGDNGAVETIPAGSNPVLKNHKVTRFLPLADQLLVATDNGLLIFKGGKWFSPGGPPLSDIHFADGKVYCATSNGVQIFDFSGWNVPDPKGITYLFSRVNAIHSNGKGLFYLGFPNGLVLTDFKGNNRSFQGQQMTISLDGLWMFVKPNPADCQMPDNNIGCLLHWDEKIWIGTKNCVAIFDTQNWQNFTSDRFEDTIKNGKRVEVEKTGNTPLLGSKIRAIVAKGDTICFGTEGGLSVFNKSTNQWSHPLKGTDLEKQGISSLCLDGGNLIVGFNKQGAGKISL